MPRPGSAWLLLSFPPFHVLHPAGSSLVLPEAQGATLRPAARAAAAGPVDPGAAPVAVAVAADMQLGGVGRPREEAGLEVGWGILYW